jgi:hypothetical protein
MENNEKSIRQLIKIPPTFCEYAAGPCDSDFSDQKSSDGLLLYPSEPELFASSIETCIPKLKAMTQGTQWLSWKDLGVSGQIIFCKICKAMRFTNLVVADVTTLNFNLLFEIGFALGLGQLVLPIRDASYTQDSKLFDELGILDTLGYIDFQNSDSLASGIKARISDNPPFHQYPPVNIELPLYLVRSHIQSDGMIRLMSAIKKSGLHFRTFDSRETTRLSLHEAFKEVCSSYAVVAHLIDSKRVGSTTHNARCAFLAGMAMASGKFTLMLQESELVQPIDYRDVIKSYTRASDIQNLVVPLVKEAFEKLQERRFIPITLPLKDLEKIDLGDLAAENEIGGLRNYFVATGQYNEAKRGRARLVVGRKGSGKTAIFYGVRSAYRGQDHLVLDLKPEGHQFTKLREAILKELSPGLRQHVLTAFWDYLLLMEIAHKIVEDEERWAYRDYTRKAAYEKVLDAERQNRSLEQADFSERLMWLVDDILERKKSILRISDTTDVTQLIYRQDIKPLSDAISDYLKTSRKEDIWVLFDNLDKGWPVNSATIEDIMIVRGLLEATRKIQRQFDLRHIDFHSIVFVRDDIYQNLIIEPADRGKETAVILDWNDYDLFKDILHRRITYSTQINQPFDVLWPFFFDTHVKGQESFSYILERTLMRPREVLRFTRASITTALNRGHDKVTEDDILQAERSYSLDLLGDMSFELKDVDPHFADLPYIFIGSATLFSRQDLEKKLADAYFLGEMGIRAIDLLLWFGFLGISVGQDEEAYSYQFQHDQKLMSNLSKNPVYCINPGFRKALGCIDVH